MKGRVAGFIVLAVWIAAPGWASAKSYSVPGIEIDAQVDPDGSVRIREDLTYLFHGRFHFAYRDIPLKAGESLADVLVSEPGRVYAELSTEAPGTFSMARRGASVRISWYYDARDERRTFRVAYRLRGVVHRYADVAELYYQFVGDDWDHAIGAVSVRVHGPTGVPASGIRAWAHGPLHGNVAIAPDGTVELDVERLPARTYWEGRILYPAEIFSGVAVSGAAPERLRIMEEEQRWADQANRRREGQLRRMEARRVERAARRKRARDYLYISCMLAAIGLVVWYRLFRKYGRPHRVTAHAAPGDPPSEHRPAILSFLLYRQATAPALVATLLDLADRGYFTIAETVREKKGWFGRTAKKKDYRFDLTGKLLADLEPFELELVEFMITQAGDVSGFTMSGLKRTARRRRMVFRKWFMKWNKEVQGAAKPMKFFEPRPVGAMVLNASLGALVLVAGIFFAVTTLPHGGLAAIVAGSIVLTLTVALQRRTPEGKRLQVEWMAFQRHLRRVARSAGPVDLTGSSWTRYLAVAVIFGMHKKLIPRLHLVDDSGQRVMPVWFYGAAPEHAFDTGVGSLADGLTAMISSVSSTMSSASGTGGGASAGGGGGSGGGGGGAG